MRKILSILFFILIFPNLAIGQSLISPKNLVKNGKFACLLGYNYNQGHWGEVGIVRGFRTNYESDPEMPALELLYPYASLSSEFLFTDKLIVCPKLGYHFVLAFVDFGLSILDYTDFNHHSFGVRPELGISLGGLFGGYYGYNLTTNKNFNVSHHNFGIKIIVGSGLFMNKEERDKRLNRINKQ